jgi:hypothetical protein
MTSDPKDPDAGPIPTPPAHADGTKESSEEELWDDLEGTPAATPLIPVNRAKPDLSSPPIQVGKAIEQQPRQVGEARINPSGKPKSRFQSDPHRAGVLGDIGELDTSGWEDAPGPVPEPSPIPAAILPPPVATPAPPPLEVPLAVETQIPAILPPEEKAATVAEVSPTPKRPKLSAVEKGGLVLLTILLLLAAAAFVIASWKRLPANPTRAEAADFPVQGKLVTIKQATTFWRIPTEQDRVRRETKMIPVVLLEVDGGPAGFRIFFRNAQNEVVGDSVSRTVQSGTHEFAATSGFEADGMHAAYRTGESEPWKVEVFEAPTADSPRQDFHKLLEVPISPDRR